MTQLTQKDKQIVSSIRAAQRTDPSIHELKLKVRAGELEDYSVSSDGCFCVVCFQETQVLQLVVGLTQLVEPQEVASVSQLHIAYLYIYVSVSQGGTHLHGQLNNLENLNGTQQTKQPQRERGQTPVRKAA
ncbi:hypothetical protein F511_20504 [Dorcoceras hygrometricum]|uniref:Uncharacterized protein n=1 Tax=Dorcoceras hygrometricum TaxID=472368 RepID=A0A2Z7AJR4_9LAMI|nr:hypothetical protein F511_20504 [Dorcoceras hygrometricum]